MREILFRGKRTANGEWVKGWFCNADCQNPFSSEIVEKAQIIDNEFLFWHEVDPETVGQYTGLCDKNGKKIFEGDILQEADGERYFVDWSTDDATWRRTTCGDGATPIEMGFDWFDASNGEVISNIHDNQELIGKAVKE